MKQIINAFEKGSVGMKALYGLGIYLAKSPIEQSLLNLIYFRVSQINDRSMAAPIAPTCTQKTCGKGETEQRSPVHPPGWSSSMQCRENKFLIAAMFKIRMEFLFFFFIRFFEKNRSNKR